MAIFRALLSATLLLLPHIASATNPLVARQAQDGGCPGKQVCGNGCIESSWTCCPGQLGGCAPTEYCYVGPNGVPGCCKNGQRCGNAISGPTTISDLWSTTATVPTTSAAVGTCEAGNAPCGDGCCDPGDYCSGADPDGKFGCCPIGETCTGRVVPSRTPAPTATRPAETSAGGSESSSDSSSAAGSGAVAMEVVFAGSLLMAGVVGAVLML